MSVTGDSRFLHRLVTGQTTYRELFDSAVSQFPQLATVQLEDLERVDPPDAPEHGRVGPWLFKWLLRAKGMSKGTAKSLTRQPGREVSGARRAKAAVAQSLLEYAEALTTSSSSDRFWQSTDGRMVVFQYLLHRFELEPVEDGEAGVLKEQLFAGETSYGAIFELIAHQEPRLNAQTLSEVREIATTLPILTKQRKRGLSGVDDHVTLTLFVHHLVGPGAAVDDELLRSTLAARTTFLVLADRFDIEPPSG